MFTVQRTEKELNLAQREAQRADNLIKHEDEIKSRRKRTWFQSEKMKKEVDFLLATDVAARGLDIKVGVVAWDEG